MNRLAVPRGRAALALRVLLLATLGVAAIPLATAAGGRASGTVVDEQGQPVANVKLRLVTEDGAPAAGPPIEVKKGKFAIASFPEGPHRLEIADGVLVVTRIEIEMRGGDGVKIGEIEQDVPAGAKPPSFEVKGSQRAQVKLVVTKPATAAGTPGGIGIEAAKASSSSLKKLNDLFTKGDMQALLTESEKVLAAEPDLGGALYLRGVALWKTGRAGEAVPVLERALANAPDQPGIHGVLGAVQLDASSAAQAAGNETEARALASAAADSIARQLAAAPGDKNALTNRVIALERAGRGDETLAALDALVAADPGDSRAYLRAAEILIDAGRNEEALGWLDRAPVRDRDVAVRMYNAAVPLFNSGKMAEAADAMRKAIAIAPDVPHPHLLLGQALISMNDLAGASAELHEFVRLAPQDPDAETARMLIAELEKK